MKTAFGLITEAGTKSDEPIKCMLREPFLDEWKITVWVVCSSLATQVGVNGKRRFWYDKTLPVPVNSTLYSETSFKL